MSPQISTEAVVPARWSVPKRVAFRFCFVYLTLFCLASQIVGGMFPIHNLETPDPATLPPVRAVIFWAAAQVFGVGHPLVYTGSGSGDKTFDWVLDFCLLIAGAIATAVWSLVSRNRPGHAALYKWFRLFLRFALASQLFVYGVDKAVPLQMPFPYLTRLLEPYGNFSPMGVLWAFVGSS